MNAFLLDIQRKNDINSTPSDRKYLKPTAVGQSIPRIYILSPADRQSDIKSHIKFSIQRLFFLGIVVEKV
jgi:hypothetical protein